MFEHTWQNRRTPPLNVGVRMQCVFGYLHQCRNFAYRAANIEGGGVWGFWVQGYVACCSGQDVAAGNHVIEARRALSAMKRVCPQTKRHLPTAQQFYKELSKTKLWLRQPGRMDMVPCLSGNSVFLSTGDVGSANDKPKCQWRDKTPRLYVARQGGDRFKSWVPSLAPRPSISSHSLPTTQRTQVTTGMLRILQTP